MEGEELKPMMWLITNLKFDFPSALDEAVQHYQKKYGGVVDEAHVNQSTLGQIKNEPGEDDVVLVNGVRIVACRHIMPNYILVIPSGGVLWKETMFSKKSTDG